MNTTSRPMRAEHSLHIGTLCSLLLPAPLGDVHIRLSHIG